MASNERVRILVVDDEKAVREFVQHALVSVGFDVCTATDGDEAVELGLRGRVEHLVGDRWALVVVMDQCGGVDEFDDHRKVGVFWSHRACCSGA